MLVADGTRDVVRNAATACSSGFGQIGFRVAAINSTFDDFQDGTADYSGNRLPFTPKYTVGGTLAAEKPIGAG